jgi:hypothetical protein
MRRLSLEFQESLGRVMIAVNRQVFRRFFSVLELDSLAVDVCAGI